jgi:hypothetical protein
MCQISDPANMFGSNRRSGHLDSIRGIQWHSSPYLWVFSRIASKLIHGKPKLWFTFAHRSSVLKPWHPSQLLQRASLVRICGCLNEAEQHRDRRFSVSTHPGQRRHRLFSSHWCNSGFQPPRMPFHWRWCYPFGRQRWAWSVWTGSRYTRTNPGVRTFSRILKCILHIKSGHEPQICQLPTVTTEAQTKHLRGGIFAIDIDVERVLVRFDGPIGGTTADVDCCAFLSLCNLWNDLIAKRSDIQTTHPWNACCRLQIGERKAKKQKPRRFWRVSENEHA